MFREGKHLFKEDKKTEKEKAKIFRHGHGNIFCAEVKKNREGKGGKYSTKYTVMCNAVCAVCTVCTVCTVRTVSVECGYEA